MILTATIEDRNGDAWLTIQSPLGVLHEDRIDTHTRAAKQRDVDWVHTQTGIPRSDVYDAIRLHEWKQRNA